MHDLKIELTERYSFAVKNIDCRNLLLMEMRFLSNLFNTIKVKKMIKFVFLNEKFTIKWKYVCKKI